MNVASITHKGLVRPNNEDRYSIRQFGNGGVLLTVADGMGGHAAGERAAQIAVDAMDGFDPALQAMATHLIELVGVAHRNVAAASVEKAAFRGMGTTLTTTFVKDGVAYWAHVGDSRLYLLRSGDLVQITEDHTIPGLLLKEGEITRDVMRTHPMKNMLLRCLGCERFEPDQGTFEVREGDLLMLSTDGLHDAVPEEAIRSILISKATLEAKLAALVQAALDDGGRDNVTVIGAEA